MFRDFGYIPIGGKVCVRGTAFLRNTTKIFSVGIYFKKCEHYEQNEHYFIFKHLAQNITHNSPFIIIFQ